MCALLRWGSEGGGEAGWRSHGVDVVLLDLLARAELPDEGELNPCLVRGLRVEDF